MGKKKTKNEPRSNYEIYCAIRKDWGVLKPVTKVIPDKRNKKPKHKKGWDEE